MTTFAPSLTSAVAVAAPMPLDPPVIMATLPESGVGVKDIVLVVVMVNVRFVDHLLRSFWWLLCSFFGGKPLLMVALNCFVGMWIGIPLVEA